MSFGESVFSSGFNQKTAKGGLFVKGNHIIPPRKQCGKTLEDSRRLSTKADPEPLPCEAGWLACRWGRLTPVGSTCQPASYVDSPLPLRMHLNHCLSRFDPRAHVGPSRLYNVTPLVL